MEQHIYSSNIITNFEHVVRGRLVQDDFLIVVGDYWEAAQFLGGLYVDEKSMIGLVQWARGLEEGPDTLLISIDGKYGALAKMSDLRNPKSGSEWVSIGDVWAPVSRVKAEVRKMLDHEPDLARKLNLRAFQKSVPDRISFLGIREDFRPETIEREINDAMSSVESATDDALVWMKIVGGIPGHRLDNKVLDAVDRELQMRLEKRSEFRSTFFPLDKVTMQEISARSRRAKRDLENCQLKFPIGQHIDDDVLYNYARKLSNDRLADLCAALYYQENWGHAPFKFLLMQLDQRIRETGR
jgi:hypothetical protein